MADEKIISGDANFEFCVNLGIVKINVKSKVDMVKAAKGLFRPIKSFVVPHYHVYRADAALGEAKEKLQELRERVKTLTDSNGLMHRAGLVDKSMVNALNEVDRKIRKMDDPFIDETNRYKLTFFRKDTEFSKYFRSPSGKRKIEGMLELPNQVHLHEARLAASNFVQAFEKARRLERVALAADGNHLKRGRCFSHPGAEHQESQQLGIIREIGCDIMQMVPSVYANKKFVVAEEYFVMPDDPKKNLTVNMDSLLKEIFVQEFTSEYRERIFEEQLKEDLNKSRPSMFDRAKELSVDRSIDLLEVGEWKSSKDRRMGMKNVA